MAQAQAAPRWPAEAGTVRRLDFDFTDIFVPHGRVFLNVAGHHFDTFLRVHFNNFDSVCTKPFDAAGKILGLADDHSADVKLPDQSAAVPARGEGRDHRLITVISLAASLAKRVRLTVNRRIVVLNTTVVTASEDLSVTV